jgi:2-dehydro-3-deoxyphosphooctonate aldolase (KDO 8-P synthase)
MSSNTLARIEAGDFFLIAGPCVIESEDLCLRVAETVAELASKYNLPYIFKSSYMKANRTSAGSPTGPGLHEGLEILKKVKDQCGLAVLTDVHETSEVAAVADVVDVLQIPAFLSRQTALIAKAAATGKWINIKKGQFMAPDDMAKAIGKADSDKIMLTERGSSFGYHNLVVDFRSFLIMKQNNLPIVFDATHSLQLPSGGAGVSSGQPQYVIPMAKAATAIGVDGLFVETHPEPAKAWSDAAAMLPLERMPLLLEEVNRVRSALILRD